MTETELRKIDFDAEFFADDGRSWDNHFRLEDLSVEDANNPPGRGRETAAPRGYDNERVARIVRDGYRVSAPWFDVQYDTDYHNLLECKLCIAEYPNGQTGTFKLWRKHHRKLLGCKNEYPDTFGDYFFLIYTVVDGRIREIGKLIVAPATIEALIDNWHYEHHVTMGQVYTKQLRWTRLLSALDLDIDQLRREEVTVASLNSDQTDQLWDQVDTHILMRNPFRRVENPYPVCGPSCEIQH